MHASTSARAPEERLAVGLVVRRQALVGAPAPTPPAPSGTGASAGSCAKDRRLELVQLGAGLRPTSTSIAGARRQRSQRIGLPGSSDTAPARASPTAAHARVPRRRTPRRGGDRSVLAGSQTGNQPVLLRRSPHLLEPAASLPGPDPTRRDRSTASPATSPTLASSVAAARSGSPPAARNVTPVDEPLELAGIDVCIADRQPIATSRRFDRVLVRSTCGAGRHDLHLLDPRLRRLVAPHDVRDLLGPNHLTTFEPRARRERRGREVRAGVRRRPPEARAGGCPRRDSRWSAPRGQWQGIPHGYR